jgi:hypothetical protein
MNDDDSWRRQDKPLSSYSIINQKSTTTNKSFDDAWERLCPPIWNNPKAPNVDVTIAWTKNDDVHAVARELLSQCKCKRKGKHSATTGNNKHDDDDKDDDDEADRIVLLSLAESLEEFRDFCMKHLTTNIVEFKARIIATRGSSGIKCPQWHVDHVPVRWIQSWKGPGCDFIMSEEGINWNAFHGLDNNNNSNNDVEEADENDDFLTVEDRNRARVDQKVAKIYSAKEKEGILLVGTRWNEFSKDDDNSQTLHPVVHKSPSIPYWQGRVRLTQDVVLDDDSLTE